MVARGLMRLNEDTPVYYALHIKIVYKSTAMAINEYFNNYITINNNIIKWKQ